MAALDTTDFELAVREARVQLQLARQDLERKQQMLRQRGIAKSLVQPRMDSFKNEIRVSEDLRQAFNETAVNSNG